MQKIVRIFFLARKSLSSQSEDTFETAQKMQCLFKGNVYSKSPRCHCSTFWGIFLGIFLGSNLGGKLEANSATVVKRGKLEANEASRECPFYLLLSNVTNFGFNQFWLQPVLLAHALGGSALNECDFAHKCQSIKYHHSLSLSSGLFPQQQARVILLTGQTLEDTWLSPKLEK